MKIIQTFSFKFAVYVDGNQDADTLILCIPGFLDAGNYEHLKSHRAYFAQRGFFCISFDPPGTFASPGDISLYTVTNYLKAIDEVIAHFGNKETIVLGHSLGGLVAMFATMKNQYIKKSIAVMSPYSFIDQFTKTKYTKRKEEKVRNGIRDIPDSEDKRQYSIPYTFVEDAFQYDGKHCIKTLEKPKLFIAGLQDDVIETETLKQGYFLASEPKSYAEINCGHNYRFDREKIQEVNRLVEKFLESTI